MDRLQKKTHSKKEAIESFWHWFAINAERLRNLYAAGDVETLTADIGRELDKVESHLAWEMGPGLKASSLFTISAEGDTELRKIAELMVQFAPTLSDWEFYSFRPPRPAPEKIQLPEEDVEFETSDWEFIPIEHAESGTLDLVILDEQLASSKREIALRAISIYLDQLLGEDTVEMWLGKFEVASRASEAAKKSYKISDLSEYLFWATHRENDPLRKANNKLQ